MFAVFSLSANPKRLKGILKAIEEYAYSFNSLLLLNMTEQKERRENKEIGKPTEVAKGSHWRFISKLKQAFNITNNLVLLSSLAVHSVQYMFVKKWAVILLQHQRLPNKGIVPNLPRSLRCIKDISRYNQRVSLSIHKT